jgi:hypothetical protein
VDEFGTSGYVYRNTFVLYDRRTESLWYPLDDEKWTAISGPRQGETIPFIDEPRPMPLGEWVEKHPDTVVLLGDRRELEAEDAGG